MKYIYFNWSIVFLIMLGGLVACSTGNKAKTNTEELQIRCISGVTYFLFSEYNGNTGFGYMSPKYNRDGSINTCE